MTTALEATDKDFEQMMQMLTGFFVTQITGAVATYSIADHLAKGPATAEQIAKIEDINSTNKISSDFADEMRAHDLLQISGLADLILGHRSLVLFEFFITGHKTNNFNYSSLGRKLGG